LWLIIRHLVPCGRPYRGLVAGTMLLKRLGALAARANPFVLRYALNAQVLRHSLK